MQKETHRRINLIAAAAVPAAVFVLDRLLKGWFVARPAFRREVISGWLGFEFLSNTGIAFGLPLPSWLLWPGIFFVLVLVGRWFARSYRSGEWIVTAALAAIFFGAVSNIIDRLTVGAVVDYIDVPWFTVFNLADCLITVGVGSLVITSLVRRPGLDKSSGA